jgi:hypothetical protein
MRLFIFEGSNDVQFFKSFLTKVLNAKDVTKEHLKLISYFKEVLKLANARIDILQLKEDLVVLLSVGGKQNFKDIAIGINPLSTILNLTHVIFIGDADAKDEVNESVNTAKSKLAKSGRTLTIDGFTYDEYLENLVINVYKAVKDVLNTDDANRIEKLLEIIYNGYKDDKYLEKRMLCCIKAVLSPRCFANLFDSIFKFAKNKINIDEFNELKKFKEFLD